MLVKNIYIYVKFIFVSSSQLKTICFIVNSLPRPENIQDVKVSSYQLVL